MLVNNKTSVATIAAVLTAKVLSNTINTYNKSKGLNGLILVKHTNLWQLPNSMLEETINAPSNALFWQYRCQITKRQYNS